MKVNFWPGLLAILVLGAAAPRLSAEEGASVKADRVNVRGQANVGSEVVTQLRKGEPVTIIEEISVEKPKPGDPAKWLKIAIPTNTPVWVNAAFLTNHVVMPKVLNIRSGPGEQFSVIGRLNKDATVQEIRVVDTWMEIVAPPNTFCFVAADLIDRPNAPAAVAKTEPTPAPAPVAATPAPAPVVTPVPAPAPAPVTETVKVEPTPAPAPVVDNAAKPIVVAEAKPAPAPAPVPAPAPEVVPVPAPAAPKAPSAADIVLQPIPSDVPGPKRVVTREGVVRRSASIQAPSAFRLANPETGDTLNYLYAGDTGLQVKFYLGKRIRVSGEEVVDARWVATPVVIIQTLEPLP